MRKLTLAFITSLVAGTAVAAPVNWVASGVIDFARVPEVLPLNPQVGEAFTYSIVFDDAIPDEYPESSIGKYPGALQSVTFSLGDRSYDIPLGFSNWIQISDDPWEDVYWATFATEEGTYPLLRTQFSYRLTSPTAPESDAIPSAPPAEWSPYAALLYLSMYQSEEQANDPGSSSTAPLVIGLVNSIEVRPVPEPATAALLAMGLVGAGLARRRRR